MNLQKRILLVSSFTALFVLSALQDVQAQLCVSNYPIRNLTSCPVSVTYKIFDPGNNCNTPCFGNNITINPGTSHFVPAGCVVAGVSDIEVQVTYAPAIITPWLNFGSGGGGGPWSCYNGGMPANQNATGPGTACNVTPGTYTTIVGCNITRIF